MNPDELIEAAGNPEMLKLDGYDEFCVGVVRRFGIEPILCYDQEGIIRSLVRIGMEPEDAIEHFEFNIIGAWMGDGTPCFISTSDGTGGDLMGQA